MDADVVAVLVADELADDVPVVVRLAECVADAVEEADEVAVVVPVETQAPHLAGHSRSTSRSTEPNFNVVPQRFLSKNRHSSGSGRLLQYCVVVAVDVALVTTVEVTVNEPVDEADMLAEDVPEMVRVVDWLDVCVLLAVADLDVVPVEEAVVETVVDADFVADDVAVLVTEVVADVESVVVRDWDWLVVAVDVAELVAVLDKLDVGVELMVEVAVVVMHELHSTGQFWLTGIPKKVPRQVLACTLASHASSSRRPLHMTCTVVEPVVVPVRDTDVVSVDVSVVDSEWDAVEETDVVALVVGVVVAVDMHAPHMPWHRWATGTLRRPSPVLNERTLPHALLSSRRQSLASGRWLHKFVDVTVDVPLVVAVDVAVDVAVELALDDALDVALMCRDDVAVDVPVVPVPVAVVDAVLDAVVAADVDTEVVAELDAEDVAVDVGVDVTLVVWVALAEVLAVEVADNVAEVLALVERDVVAVDDKDVEPVVDMVVDSDAEREEVAVEVAVDVRVDDAVVNRHELNSPALLSSTTSLRCPANSKQLALVSIFRLLNEHAVWKRLPMPFAPGVPWYTASARALPMAVHFAPVSLPRKCIFSNNLHLTSETWYGLFLLYEAQSLSM